MPSSLANVLFGPPPKVRHQLAGPPPQVPSAGDGLARPPMDLETPGQAEGEVSAALTQQSNALTMLVTHLISQASEASDFGGGQEVACLQKARLEGRSCRPSSPTTRGPSCYLWPKPGLGA